MTTEINTVARSALIQFRVFPCLSEWVAHVSHSSHSLILFLQDSCSFSISHFPIVLKWDPMEWLPTACTVLSNGFSPYLHSADGHFRPPLSAGGEDACGTDDRR